MGIYIYLSIILIVTFYAFNIKHVKNRTAYGFKFLWYSLTFLIGIFSFCLDGYDLENIYGALLFVIIIVEALDNLRLFSLTKNENEE